MEEDIVYMEVIDFSDYADQTYGLLAGSHCPIDFDGVTATVQVWSDDDSNSEDFSCWR